MSAARAALGATLACAAASCLGAAAGCAGPSAAVPTPAASIGEMEQAQRPSLAPRDLYPPVGITLWAVTDDSWMRTEPAPREGTMREVGGTLEWTEPMGTTVTAALAQDGSVSMRSSRVPSDSAISHFDPPLLLATPSQPGAEPLETSAPMRVDWIRGGERDSGSGTRTSRILGQARVRTPAGEADAIVVENVFEAQLRMARARRQTTLWVVPGQGPVAERWTQTVFVLGFPAGSTRGASVRIAPTLAAPAETAP